MIKKILFSIGALLAINATLQANVATPDVVVKFYDGMEALTKTCNVDEVRNLESTMKYCFPGKWDSGINLPNDFRFFVLDNASISHTNNTLTSNTYVDKLSDFAFSKKALKVKIDILGSEYEGSTPDFNSRQFAPEYACIKTLVRKTFTLNNEIKVFNDTVYTYMSSNLITKICNGQGMQGEDPNTLRIKAALAYERKSYYEAYKYYEQIVALDSKDADSYYRLGLMTYWQQGCDNKFSRKKYARSKGKEYLELAAKNYSYDHVLVDKVNRVLTYIKYYNQ